MPNGNMSNCAMGRPEIRMAGFDDDALASRLCDGVGRLSNRSDATSSTRACCRRTLPMPSKALRPGSRAPSAFGADQCQPPGLRSCPGRALPPTLSGVPRRSCQSWRPARGRLYDRSGRSVCLGERRCGPASARTSTSRHRRPSAGSAAPRQGVSRIPAVRCGGCRPRTR